MAIKAAVPAQPRKKLPNDYVPEHVQAARKLAQFESFRRNYLNSKPSVLSRSRLSFSVGNDKAVCKYLFHSLNLRRFAAGKIATVCIGACYDDMITETIITLAFPFIIFICAEYLAKVSGANSRVSMYTIDCTITITVGCFKMNGYHWIEPSR